MNTLYKAIMDKVHEKQISDLKSTFKSRVKWEKIFVIPPHRTRYLSKLPRANTTFQQLAEQVAQNYMEFSKLETVSGKVPEIKRGIMRIRFYQLL
jgi:methylmalonyl-CoA mutase